MGLFNEITRFGDLFHSIRQHEQYFVVDLKLPLNWQVETILSAHQEKVAFKVNGDDTSKGYRLISFFSTMTEGSVEYMVGVLEEVIKVNKEIEEKKTLLTQKKVELENMFNSFSLDELKKISFNVEADISLNGLKDIEEKIDGNRTEASAVVTEEHVEGQEGPTTT
tara:strand:- start:2791 stop:3288 length:498 start_codon:yes stop_codon:yes gene_type:complete